MFIDLSIFIYTKPSFIRPAPLITLSIWEAAVVYGTDSIWFSMELLPWRYIPWPMKDNDGQMRICLLSLTRKFRTLSSGRALTTFLIFSRFFPFLSYRKMIRLSLQLRPALIATLWSKTLIVFSVPIQFRNSYNELFLQICDARRLSSNALLFTAFHCLSSAIFDGL